MSFLPKPPSTQLGVALPVALIMLLISTMIGLASIRTATNQEKISANMYDRSLAYQATEAASIASSAALKAAWMTQNPYAPAYQNPPLPPQRMTGSI